MIIQEDDKMKMKNSIDKHNNPLNQTEKKIFYFTLNLVFHFYFY